MEIESWGSMKVQIFLVCSFVQKTLWSQYLIGDKLLDQGDNFGITLLTLFSLQLQVQNTEEAFEGALKAAGLL